MISSDDVSAKWATWDIESEEWIRFRVGVVYDGTTSRAAWSVPALLDLFDDLAGPGRVFWAHYGGKFDIKFILPDLLRRHAVSFQVVNGGVARLKVYDGRRKLYELRDSYNILPLSLRELARSFQTTQKLVVDRRNIAALTNDEVLEYCAVDCVALREILLSAREKQGVKDFKMTIASQAFADWKTTSDERQYRTASRHYPMLRAAYYGGRTEVFCRHGKDLNYYDVRSMYPFVMRNNPYPSGHTMKTRRFDADRLGVYTVEVTSPRYMEYPFLPVRSSTGKLLFPLGHWCATYTSAEIAYAKTLGYRFRILDGVVWSERGAPFAAYVDKWYAVKDAASKSGDEAMKIISKLHLNSLYGKFGQRRTFRRIVQGGIRQEDLKKRPEDLFPDLGLYTIEEEDKKPFVYTGVAAFVTSYARIRLYEGFREVERAGGRVYYCDTDSIVTDSALEESPALGGWDKQERLKEGIFLLPKVYAAISEEKTSLKAKGFSHDDLNIRAYRRALRGDFSLFRSEREGVMGLYEASKRSAAVLSRSLLVRTLAGTFDKRAVQKDGVTTKPLTVDTFIS